MRKSTLKYTFYNPNTDEETIEFLIKIFAEVSKTKFENAIQSAALDNLKSVGR